MPGQTSYTNAHLGVTHVGYWNTHPGDVIPGERVSDFIGQAWNRLAAGCSNVGYLMDGGPFKGLQIHTWNPYHPEVGSIRNYAGLTYTDRPLIEINQASANEGTYSHEFGHHYAKFAYASPAGAEIYGIWLALRGQDFTQATPEAERFAEDFRFYFGADGVAGSLNPGDDHYTQGRRHPDAVPGMKQLIKYAWPVAHYLKGKRHEALSYSPGYLAWWRPDLRCWECCAGSGNLYRHVNGNWQMI